MESPGITFDVQWKRKPGVVSREEDSTSIGIWDPENTSLDWETFKSYVCQNLGTVDDITVAYVDSEGDELPIESECEFQEALKFARQRAHKGRETVLKVDKQGSPISEASENQLKATFKTVTLRHDKPKYLKSFNKSAHKILGSGDRTLPAEERKTKSKKNTESGPEQERIRRDRVEQMTRFMEELKLSKLEKEDAPPQWFKKYMQKMKAEIVADVLKGTRHMLENSKSGCPCQGRILPTSVPLPVPKSKKKRISDEDSSDGALGSDTRDHKLLKKIEKLHKREKKLEKKLDSKLEKLENKTKRMMEKKSQSKSRTERIPERRPTIGARKKSGDLPVGTYLMDAILLNDGSKPEVHIRHGQNFTKVWEVMNTGTLPWTDKTELRQTWRTLGLEPEESVVKCPILDPGEKGQITVKFRAPEFPGTFESYWHFYHMGDRFGHWIGCAVVVDPKEGEPEKTDILQECSEKKEVTVGESQPKTEHAVDLTMKSNSKQFSHAYAKCSEMNKLTCEKPPSEEICGQGAEYESDSDSDNLSVISGTITLSSDSEDEENFVVVPMPACFMCDIPLGTGGTVPVTVSEKSEKDRLEKQCDTSCNTEAVLVDVSVDNEEQNQAETEHSKPSPVHSEPSINQEREYVGCLRQRVYAVDMAGHCLPVETSHSASQYNSHETERGQPQESNGSTNIPSQDQGDSANSQPQNENSSTGASPQDPLGNVIHILPETLVTGAVNVATSAFSTARAVISNLRSRPAGEFTEWQWYNNTGNLSAQTDRSTSESLKLLVEMGFTNKILNVLLLQRYDNDVSKVVAELLNYEEHSGSGKM